MIIIKRLCIMDFDGTLINSPEPEEGKLMWEKYYGKSYPNIGWWGRPESLDLNVFDIKPFPSLLKQLEKEKSIPNTYTVMLTSRMEKLRPQVQAVLDKNNIVVDKLDMKHAEGNKGKKVLRYVELFQDLKVINVYDDRDSDIQAYEAIRSQMPRGVEFNIYLANQGTLALTENNKLINIVNEEINDFINYQKSYVYHDTSIGAAISIQRVGKMTINNEPYISFSSKPEVAKYYAMMKGGSSNRSVILRTKLTDDFVLSPKYKKNADGFEYITKREIPTNELEVYTHEGWININDWDFIDNKIKN